MSVTSVVAGAGGEESEERRKWTVVCAPSHDSNDVIQSTRPGLRTAATAELIGARVPPLA